MLLYYVHRTTFNKINWKFLPIIIIHFYRLIWFNIWRCFLWQTIYQVFQFRSPWFKIYRCMLLQSTKYFKILNNPTILHTKKFLSQPVTCAIKYHLIQNFHILHWYTHSIIIQHRLFRNTIQTKKKFNISLFPSLELGLKLRLRCNQPLALNRYIPLHVTTPVAYYLYFYVLFKYYHTKRDGGVLESPCSLQIFHTNKEKVVLGNTIQDYQRKILFRASRLRLTF